MMIMISEEFKRIFKKYFEEGMIPSEIAKDEWVSEATIRDWLQGKSCANQTKELREKYPDYYEVRDISPRRKSSEIPEEEKEHIDEAFEELKDLIFYGGERYEPNNR